MAVRMRVVARAQRVCFPHTTHILETVPFLGALSFPLISSLTRARSREDFNKVDNEGRIRYTILRFKTTTIRILKILD